MARKLKPNDDGADAGATTNKSARSAIIRRGYKELYALDTQINDMKEEHIKPLQKKRNKIMRTLRKDTDMKGADLSPHYKLFKRAADAAAMTDEGHGADILDNMKEIHESLHPRTTVDWITALEAVA
tara:strand:- start:167 stop:547 length:381 start_codon:yes stop_codon:yes gene_type:complete